MLIWKRKVSPAELGRMGERRAAWFYRLRGFRIVARNVRTRAGEIDLIARRGRTVVVAEVKTRQSLAAGEGFEAVDAGKQLRLVRLADAWIARERPHDVELRYDVLSLFWTGWRFEVRHFPDAFRPVADPQRPWLWRV
jgi:putative endonuclease